MDNEVDTSEMCVHHGDLVSHTKAEKNKIKTCLPFPKCAGPDTALKPANPKRSS